MTTPYVAGQVLTAAELNASFNAKTDNAAAAITGGTIAGVQSIQVVGATDSVSPTTGALVVVGGVGIGIDLQVGGNITAGGDVFVNGATNASSPTTGAIVVIGGVGVGMNLNVGGAATVAGTVTARDLVATDSTDATTSATGALVVVGGVGIGKSLYVGGAAHVQGALTVAGLATLQGEALVGYLVLASGGYVQFQDGSQQSTAGVVNGEFAIATTGSNTNVTAGQSAAANIFKVTGVLTSNATITLPAVPKTFTLQNNTTGGFSLTVLASGQSPSVPVIQGTAGTLFTDATGCYATSAASGIGFASEITVAANSTLALSAIGAIAIQTVAAVVTTLPLANTYPSGKGVTISNKSTGNTSIALQGSDTTEAPLTLYPGDTYFLVSNGTSAWQIGWYSATKTFRTTNLLFADGTTQTTANGTTAPTSVWYTVGATDTVGGFAAGDTSLRTSGFSSPFVEVIRGGLVPTRGQHYTLNVDTIHINGLDPLTADDQIEVKTKVIYSPQTSYSPSFVPLSPAVAATFIAFAHTAGFAPLINGGVWLTPGVDYTDDATGYYLTSAVDTGDSYAAWSLTPLTLANMVTAIGGTLTNPIISGSIVYPDASTGVSARPGYNRVVNGSCRIQQRPAAAAVSGTSGAYSIVDRYKASNGGAGGSFAQSASNIVYGGRNRPCVAQTVATALTNLGAALYWGGIAYSFEGLDVFDLVGQPVTISFIFQASLAGSYSVSLRDSTGANTFLTSINVAVGGTPQRYVIQVPAIPAGAVIPNTTGVGMTICIGAQNNGTYAAAASGAWQAGNFITASSTIAWGLTVGAIIAMAELQLELGSVPNPVFERLPAGEELFRCQRYYQVLGDYMCVGYQSAGGAVYSDGVLPVTMRTVPAIAINGTVTYANASALSSGGAQVNKFRLQTIITATGYGYGFGAPLSFDADY